MSDEMKKKKEVGYQGKMAYELIMQTFSRPGDKKKPAVAAGCFAINLTCVEIYPSFTGTTAVGAATTFSHRYGNRNSKLNMIGDALRERILDASRQQQLRKCSNMADNRVWAAVVTYSDSSLPPSAMRECQYAAKMMEDILFSCGGAENTVAMLRYFKDRQTITEA